MRARPVDAAALRASPEVVVVAAGQRRDPIDDVVLGHIGDDAAAAHTATERREPTGQVETADHLDDLLERTVRVHEHTVGDIAAFEQSAVASQQDPVLGGRDLGQHGVLGVPFAADVHSQQPQQPREPAQIDVDDEARIAQRAGAHPSQWPDVQRFEHRVRGEPIAGARVVAEADRRAVHQQQIDLGVRDARGLHDVFHGLMRTHRPPLRREPDVRGQEIVQLGVHAQFDTGGHRTIVVPVEARDRSVIDNGGMPTVLLGGDVMLGRGMDQVLPHPGDPALRERFVEDARTYVQLAENANGPLTRPVDFRAPWGDALPFLALADVRLINLETAITAGGTFAPAKGIHYRMNPRNVPVLTVIAPVVCALANNHVLDFGVRGLTDTLRTLDAARVDHAGAGEDLDGARAPATAELDDRRRAVIVSVAAGSSGVPEYWAAQHDRPGLWRVGDAPSLAATDEIAETVTAYTRPQDVAIVSIHWGPNWGYRVTPSERRFAHRLIDAGVDVVHGHSAHHPRPIEFYRGKPILYGCGDVVDDYEGIGGHARYRTDLRLLFLVTVDSEIEVRLIPLRMRNMRLQSAGYDESRWLCDTMADISRGFDTRVAARPDDLPVVYPAAYH